MTLLDKAKHVRAERSQDYSVQLDDFQVTANLWSAYLGKEISKEDVAHMMILLKVGRDKVNERDDNLVDICGYADCLFEMRANGQPKVFRANGKDS